LISLKGAQVIRKNKLFIALTQNARNILKSEIKRGNKLKAICKLLKDNVHYYNWVGFYAINKERPTELVLVSYVGKPTQHLRIQFGKGICGQAAMLRKTLVVQDVSKETNYLSCSSKVKSEIVVPIFRNKEIVGELDIDSHIASPFTLDDETFLKEIAEMVSEFL
jgi:GAF domain-containing protein